MVNKFEELDCWKVSKELAVSVYHITGKERCRKDYGFSDQMRRAAVSVMNNVAEGFDRGSNKDFIRFLYIARASAAEVRSMTYLALDLAYITQDEYEMLQNLCRRCGGLTWGLIKSLKKHLSLPAKISVMFFVLSMPLFKLFN